MSEHNKGYDAAKAGRPSSDCPHTIPERPSQGDAYPGDWINWMSGWCLYNEFKGNETGPERDQMCKIIGRGLL